jgi:hypothetical protein
MPRGGFVKIYNVTGYLIILVYMLACMHSAPGNLGPWTGLLIGAVYFIFCWFLGGLYLADLLHLGIAHRSLDYKEWFIKLVTVVNNIFAIYVDPIAWVNRHRLHHKNLTMMGIPINFRATAFGEPSPPPPEEMVIPTITFADSSSVSDYGDPSFQDYLRNG